MILDITMRFFKDVRSTLRHPLAAGATLLTISKYLALLVGLLTNIAAARLLGPENYGVAALVISFPSLLWSFASFKPITVTTRYISKFRAAQQDKALSGTCKLGYGVDLIMSGAVFIVVALAGSWVTRNIYNLPDFTWLMIAYAVTVPLQSLTGTSEAILSAWEKFDWLALGQVVNKSVIFLLVLGFFLAGFGISGLVMGIGVGEAIYGLVVTFAATCLMRQSGLPLWWKGSINELTSLRTELISFFGWNYIIVSLSGVLTQVPLILLGRVSGPQDAGFYRLATTLVTMGTHLEASLGKVVYPRLSVRWGEGERANILISLRRWTVRIGLPLGVLFLFAAIALLPFLIPQVFGPDYAQMVPGVQLMVGATAVRVVFFWINPYYFASGEIRQFARIYGVYVLLTVVSGWILVHSWGFLGMAMAIFGGKVLYTLVLAKPVINSRSMS